MPKSSNIVAGERESPKGLLIIQHKRSTANDGEEVSAGSNTNANEGGDDTANDGEEVSAGSNTNANEDGDDTANEGEEVLAGVQWLFNCIPCGLSTNSGSNFEKHKLTQKHIDRMRNPEGVLVVAFSCTNCLKMYRGYQWLMKHQQTCRAPEPIISTVPAPVGTVLRTEVDNLD